MDYTQLRACLSKCFSYIVAKTQGDKPMRSIIFAILLITSFSVLNAAMAWDWAVQTYCSSIAVNGMAIDKQDNVYLATKFFGDFKYDGKTLSPVGGEDILILKYNSSGKLLWALPAGGEDTDNALAIAISPSGGIYAAGNFVQTASFGSISKQSVGDYHHDIFVAKISDAGAWEWVKTFGNEESETVFGLQVDSRNNIYLAGNFTNSLQMDKVELSTSEEFPAFFLARLNSKGNTDWAVPIKLVSDGYINKLVLNHQEQPAIAGNFDIEMFIDTELILISNGDWDGFVCQFDDKGYALWAKTFGGESTDSVNDMVCDKDGNLYITGNFNQTITLDKEHYSGDYANIMVAKISPAGNWLWSNACGGDYGNYSVAITLKPNGNVVMGGNFNNSMIMDDIVINDSGDDGLFVAETDKDGVWKHLLGAPASAEESVRHMVTDSKGEVIVVGDFTATLPIAGATLESSAEGYYDKELFVAKIKTVK